MKDELVLTTQTAIPLVRYNIHDTGKILKYFEVVKLLEKYNILDKARDFGLNIWKLPFLVLKGRTDVAVTFYALNIYPENIRVGLEVPKLKKLFTGNFFAYNKNINKGKTQKLYFRLELKDGILPSTEIEELARICLIKKLLEVNIEYRKLYSIINEKAIPVIELISYGKEKFPNQKERGILSQNGKKPRVILK